MRKVKTKPKGTTKVGYCRDCTHSYDYHEKNVKGEFFMARCPFSKWSVFLNHDSCDKIELRQNNG